MPDSYINAYETENAADAALLPGQQTLTLRDTVLAVNHALEFNSTDTLAGTDGVSNAVKSFSFLVMLKWLQANSTTLTPQQTEELNRTH